MGDVLISRYNLILKAKTIFSKRFFAKLLVSYSVFVTLAFLFVWAGFSGLKKEYREETSNLRKRVADLTDRLYPQPTSQPTLIAEHQGEPCVKEAATLFSDDKLYAACLVDGDYRIYRQINLNFGKKDYIAFSHETGRYEFDGKILISHAEYQTTTDGIVLENIGSKVFEVDPKKKKLAVLITSKMIPNKDLFISGTDYSAQYTLPVDHQQDFPLLSPHRTKMLVFVSTCTGCETYYHLYAYSFQPKELIYIGVPYFSYEERRYFIEWRDDNTIRWREGRWRDTTKEDYDSGQSWFVMQDDLGYKVTKL